MSKVICPICRTPMPGAAKEWPDFPFCSPRCKLIDLGRWLGEKYAVAPDPDDGPAEEGDGADLPP